MRVSGILFFCAGIVLFNCGKKAEITHPAFTKADSVTDLYLSLQDSVLQSWNVMINDDNKKISAMRHLLHELEVTNAAEPETIKSYEERLDQLVTMRYNQKSMANADVIEEYDFASNSMVTELVSLAESRGDFTSEKLQVAMARAVARQVQRLYDHLYAATFQRRNCTHSDVEGS